MSIGPGAQLQPTDSCNSTGHKAAVAGSRQIERLGAPCPADVLGLGACHAGERIELSRAQRDAQGREKDVNLSATQDDQHGMSSVLRFILETSNPTPAAAPYRYVYVIADGTARELHASERQYLETEFSGGDGVMPYIKSSYSERDG